MDDILKALLPGKIVSGERISKALGITRAAVWKRITALRERGFVIESLDRQGYLLVHVPDVLMSSLITYGLETEWAGRHVFCYESVDSTNRVLKTMAADGADHGTLVVANEQTGGRGRRGRGWLTPKDTSIAMSLLLRPEIPPAKVALLSLAASVAVAKGIRQVTSLEAGIKWPNDIVVNGKKVCGILLEMDADEQNVHYIVAGVGINVHLMDIPEEIRATATSLDLELGHPCSRVEIVKAVMRATEETEKLLKEGVERGNAEAEKIIADSLKSKKAHAERMHLAHWGADIDFYDRIRNDSLEKRHGFVSTGKELWQRTIACSKHYPWADMYIDQHDRKTYYLKGDKLVKLNILTGDTICHSFSAGVKEPTKSRLSIVRRQMATSRDFQFEEASSSLIGNFILTGTHSNIIDTCNCLYVADAKSFVVKNRSTTRITAITEKMIAISSAVL